MSYYDPRVERKSHHICHVVSENESIQLSDKSRHDIFSTVRATADYWKMGYDLVKEENHALRWNELKLWVKQNKIDNYEIILKLMKMLDEKIYIRSIGINDLLNDEQKER
jgi:hypothetical protein